MREIEREGEEEMKLRNIKSCRKNTVIKEYFLAKYIFTIKVTIATFHNERHSYL